MESFGWVDAATAAISFFDWLFSLNILMAMLLGLMAGLAFEHWAVKAVEPSGTIVVNSPRIRFVVQFVSTISCASITGVMMKATTTQEIGLAVVWGLFSPLTYAAGLAVLKWRYPDLIEKWKS